MNALGPEGIAAERLFPHLVVLGAIIRADPRWAWVAAPLVRHRVGALSIKGAVPTGGMTQYTITVTGQRAAISARMFGRRSALYRRAMRKHLARAGQSHASSRLQGRSGAEPMHWTSVCSRL